ncbi:SRPBCC family protein [Nocardioides sp.]|uniref:SRPBCC family protein n=1 Tax=Nocardioides sp. TaxID=35761 RepID=UPI003D099DC8
MGSFEVVRQAQIDAPAETLHSLISNFHEWTAWSPWEDVDPDLHRVYSGPESGPGAHYAWSGNRKAGQGSMEITSSTPTVIRIALSFLKPFKAVNDITFELEPGGSSTGVTWRMTGEQSGLMALFGKVVSMDRLVGKDFEKGLTRLKAVAESP